MEYIIVRIEFFINQQQQGWCNADLFVGIEGTSVDCNTLSRYAFRALYSKNQKTIHAIRQQQEEHEEENTGGREVTYLDEGSTAALP
jgi:hypothetical protein